jgi:hypothetical protein
LALFDRVNTKTWPLEFTATPGTSPKFVPGGEGEFGTDSKGISGTAWLSNAGTASSTDGEQACLHHGLYVAREEETTLESFPHRFVRRAA